MTDQREHRYREQLDSDVFLSVRWRIERGRVLDYGVTLYVVRRGVAQTVCVFDNAHGQPEMHPYRAGAKQEARKLSPKGNANLDLAAAVREVRSDYAEIIERWEL